jgi:nucleoside phosphorylase
VSSELTVVVAALPEEAAQLRRRIASPQPSKRGAGAVRSLVEGRIGGRPVALAVSGDGRLNAARAARWLLSELPCGRLWVIGMSGALHARLSPLELVVAEEVRPETSGVRYRADAFGVARAVSLAGARPAVAVTAERLASDARSKAELGALGAEVVDLESLHFARAAAETGVPWLVLRAVSDALDEPLPELLAECQGPGGALERRRVLLRALARPRSWPPLLALRARAVRSSGVLAAAVEALLLGPALTEAPTPTG